MTSARPPHPPKEPLLPFHTSADPFARSGVTFFEKNDFFPKILQRWGRKMAPWGVWDQNPKNRQAFFKSVWDPKKGYGTTRKLFSDKTKKTF